MTLRALLAPHVLERPDEVALIGDESVLSFSALDDRIGRAVAVLDRLVGNADPVAAIGPNHPDWIVAQHAVPESGRLLVFLNHRLSVPELADQLRRARVSLVLGDVEQLDRLREGGVDLPSLSWSEWDRSIRDGSPADGAPLDESAPAWLLFTSGTTGRPKGALLTARSLTAAVRSSAAARPVDPDDVYVFPFPLCHVAAYNVLHRHAHGRPVVLVDRFDPPTYCDAVQRHAVTSTSLAATMLATLLDWIDADTVNRVPMLSTLRTVAYGAAPMSGALLRRAFDLLGVEFAQGYGMTELSGNAVFLDAESHRRGLDRDPHVLRAAGRPAPGVELQIAADGEICVRADQMMSGYLDDPDATASTIVDGWLRTGDAGYIDDSGLLFVVDRIKDIVITGGENVSSLEVEDVVAGFEGVASAAVIGVPDTIWGENVCAFVVPRAGTVLDIDALVLHVRSRLAGFKTPRHVVVVDALPVNASGKVLKSELREMVDADPALLGERLGR